MKRARVFHAELTRLVRQRVAASPAMTKEYKRRHAWDVWKAIWIYLLWFLSPLLVATGVSVMPVAVFLPALGPLIATSIGAGPVDVPLALAAQSQVIAAIACFVMGVHAGKLFCFPSDLAVFAHFPVSDRQLLQRTLPSWRIHLAYYIYVLGFVYVVLAGCEGLSWLQAFGIALLTVLQAWHFLSLAVIAAHQIRWRPSLAFIGLLLFAAFYCAAMLEGFLFLMPVEHQHGTALAAMLLPTGWINGAIYYGVFRGSLTGCLFLVPVAATSAYAVWWLRRGYAIREIRVSSLGTIRPVFAYGLPNASDLDDKPTEAKKDALPDDATSAAPESRQAIEKRLLCSPSLAPADWSRRGFVERWIGALLTPRERVVLDQFYVGSPFWTAAWLASATVAGVIITVVLVSAAREFVIAALFLLPATVIFAGVVFEMLAYLVCRGNERERGMPSLHPVFPVGLSETLSAQAKTLCLRAILCLPLIGLLLVAEEWLCPGAWTKSIAMAVVALIQAGAVYAVCVRARFAAMNRARFQWRRWIALGCLCLAVLANFPLLLVFQHCPITLLSASLMLLFVWLACRQFDYLYTRTEFDFDAPNPMQPWNGKRSAPIAW